MGMAAVIYKKGAPDNFLAGSPSRFVYQMAAKTFIVTSPSGCLPERCKNSWTVSIRVRLRVHAKSALESCNVSSLPQP
jgi:hypothetical protein